MEEIKSSRNKHGQNGNKGSQTQGKKRWEGAGTHNEADFLREVATGLVLAEQMQGSVCTEVQLAIVRALGHFSQ